jgi:class 3 adenylate cyclase
MADEPDQTISSIEERKLVTALFADLVSSTTLATSLDPEDLNEVLRSYFARMVEEIITYGGTVRKIHRRRGRRRVWSALRS